MIKRVNIAVVEMDNGGFLIEVQDHSMSQQAGNFTPRVEYHEDIDKVSARLGKLLGEFNTRIHKGPTA